MLKRTRSLLANLPLVVGCGAALATPLGAQDPNHVFEHTDGAGAPGALVELRVLADNTGGNIDGWSFGVCTDLAQVEVVSVDHGAVIQSFNGGSGPFFSNVEILADGWTAGLVVN